jgi:hypothetical protein
LRRGHARAIQAAQPPMTALDRSSKIAEQTRRGIERHAVAPLARSLLGHLGRARHVAHQQTFDLLGRTRDTAMLAGLIETERLVKAHCIAVGVGDPRVDFRGAFSG